MKFKIQYLYSKVILILLMSSSLHAIILDKLYHPVCKTTKSQCTDKELDSAIKYGKDTLINPTGWEACFNKKQMLNNRNSNLNRHTYCSKKQLQNNVVTPYYQAWLEYDESGEHHDNNQIKAIDRWIKKHNKKPLTVVIYIHGWQNNADTSSNNPRHNAIKFPFLISRVVDTTNKLAYFKQIPKQDVLGIYVGWRGEKSNGIFTFLTIGNRAKVATKIGKKGILKKDLQHIAKAIGEKNHIIVFGHSLGGRMLTSTFKSSLECKDTSDNNDFNSTAPLGKHSLIVTLNAAVHANCYNSVFNRKDGCNPKSSRPYWVNITSKDDIATSKWYRRASKFHLVKGCKGGNRRYNTIGHYKPYIYQVLENSHQSKNHKNFEKYYYERDWFLHTSSKHQRLTFPNLSNMDEAHATHFSYDFRLNTEDNDFVPKDALTRKVWNVRTDSTLIDFGDAGGGRMSGHHNGYISTVLTRLLTEMLFYAPKKK